MTPARIMVVRLSAMGDILHALPAVASLKASFPEARITWAVKPRWASLLGQNPHVDRVWPVEAPDWLFRSGRFDLAIDFQGLVQSALVARTCRPRRLLGFDYPLLRERAAGLFYSERGTSAAAHVVDRNLDLAAAAGAAQRIIEFPLPDCAPEGRLPDSDFLLASPGAGWRSKQWPPDHYARLAGLVRQRFGWPLVLNCAPPELAAAEAIARQAPPGAVLVNASSVAGLIGATRRARGVIGVDSGPLHLAAALRRPGVALFGPTDPARNGPYGDTFTVLRAPGALTTYQRENHYSPSMLAIRPEQVVEALEARLARRPVLESTR